MRAFSSHALALLSVAVVFQTACTGLTNKEDAMNAQVSLSSSNVQQCHLTIYQESTAAYVQTSCISCHGNAGYGALLLKTGASADAFNLSALSNYIESSAANAEASTLIGKVSGSLSHPMKLSVGSDSLAGFLAITNSIISNPNCDSTAVATPTPGFGSSF